MTTVLEILKYVLPSLIVLGTAYILIKKFIDGQYQMKALELKANYSKEAIPLKLQAYERLILLCERVSIPQLLLRLKGKEMTAKDLKNAMVISAQKEFEHNMAQQLYCSGKLWDIITLAKNDTIALITNTYNENLHSDDPAELANQMMQKLGQMSKSPIHLAIQAVKEEAKIILDL